MSAHAEPFDTADFSRRARSNYRTGAVFYAIVSAVDNGVYDDAELLKIAEKAEQEFDRAHPRKA